MTANPYRPAPKIPAKEMIEEMRKELAEQRKEFKKLRAKENRAKKRVLKKGKSI